MNQQDAGGREWRPYEIAMPITQPGGDAALPTPLARSMPAGVHRPLPGIGAHDEPVMASLRKRFIGALIDSVLWGLPLLFVVKGVMQAYHMQQQGLRVSMDGLVTKGVVTLVLWTMLSAWNLVWIAMHSQTVGKRFAGTRVVRSNGERVGFFRYVLLRSFVISLVGGTVGRVIPIGNLLVWLVDVLFIFSDDRRTLHDRIADTIVVDA